MKRLLILAFVSMMVLFLNSIVATNFAQDAEISDDTANIQDDDDDDDWKLKDENFKGKKDKDDEELENEDKNKEKQRAFVKEMNEKALKIVLDWIEKLDKDKLKQELKKIADENDLLFYFKDLGKSQFNCYVLDLEDIEVNNFTFSYLPKMFEKRSFHCSKMALSDIVTEICSDLNYVFPQIEGEERFVTCNFKNISRMGILSIILETHGYELFINDNDYEYWYNNEFKMIFSMHYIYIILRRIIDTEGVEFYKVLNEIYKDTLGEDFIDGIALAHIIIKNADNLNELFLDGVNDDLKEYSKEEYIINIPLPE